MFHLPLVALVYGGASSALGCVGFTDTGTRCLRARVQDDRVCRIAGCFGDTVMDCQQRHEKLYMWCATACAWLTVSGGLLMLLFQARAAKRELDCDLECARCVLGQAVISQLRSHVTICVNIRKVGLSLSCELISAPFCVTSRLESEN